MRRFSAFSSLHSFFPHFFNTVEPLYNEVLGTMKITLLYQVSCYIRVKKQRNIKSWDQQIDLVIRGFCYIRPLYNEVPLYHQYLSLEGLCVPVTRKQTGSHSFPFCSAFILYAYLMPFTVWPLADAGCFAGCALGGASQTQNIVSMVTAPHAPGGLSVSVRTQGFMSHSLPDSSHIQAFSSLCLFIYRILFVFKSAVQCPLNNYWIAFINSVYIVHFSLCPFSFRYLLSYLQISPFLSLLLLSLSFPSFFSSFFPFLLHALPFIPFPSILVFSPSSILPFLCVMIMIIDLIFNSVL